MTPSDGPGAARRPRIHPSVPVAAVVFVVYVVVVVGLMRVSGVGYEHFFDTPGTTVRSAVLPLAAGGLWLTVFVLWARWDHVFRDAQRLPMGRFLWFLPAVMVVLALLFVAGTGWAELSASHVLALVAAAVLVGYSEEMLFRGVVLRSLREGARSEGMAVLWTTLWFGGFHLTNLLLGEPGAVVQWVLAALTGTGLYLARRGTGTIVGAMVLHGLWDFSTFASGVSTTDGVATSFAAFLTVVVYLLAAVTLVVLVVRERRRPAREAIGA